MIMKGRLFSKGFIAILIASLGFNVQVLAQKGDVYEIGLSMYSLRQLFEVRGGTLDPLDYPEFAKEKFGFTMIIDFHGIN